MGPGTYTPDRTEGITRVEDLPPPVVRRRRKVSRRPRPALKMVPHAQAA